MKLYKTLGLSLCCLLGLVACKKDNDVEISNIQYNMDKYEEKAISVAVNRCKEEFQKRAEDSYFENAKIEELQIISVNCTSAGRYYIKYEIFMFVATSYYGEFYDEKQYETYCVSYNDIQVSIESEYIEEA